MLFMLILNSISDSDQSNKEKTNNGIELPQIDHIDEDILENIMAPPNNPKTSFEIGGGLNYLNMLHLTSDEKLSPVIAAAQPFKNLFLENFINLQPLEKKVNSYYPFACSVPLSLSRRHMFYMYRTYPDMPNEYTYFSKTNQEMLGNMAQEHPFNRRSEKDIELAKRNGIDIVEQPMAWTPIYKERDNGNKYIQTSDYARYVYHCERYEFESDFISNSSNKESINSIKFWYKDSSNAPSAVRAFQFNDLIEEHSKHAYFYREGRYGLQPKISLPYEETKLKKLLLSQLQNKIIVVEHRRINTTTHKGNSNCPIINHYIEQGWKLMDDTIEGNPYSQIFSCVVNFIKDRELVDNINYGRFGMGKHNSGYYIGDKFIQDQELRSVTLTRTTFIDIESSGLNDQKGVYFKDVDLVIGKMKTYDDNGNVSYPVDYIHHPNSIDGYNRDNNPIETIELVYIDNKQLIKAPLYFSTHGLISKVFPKKSHKMTDGMYIIKRKGDNVLDVRKINPEVKMKYGIFNTKEDAELYVQVTEKFSTDLREYRTHMLHDHKFNQSMEIEAMKFELEKKKGENAKEILDKTSDIKSKEQEVKMKELQYKATLMELEMKKLEMIQIPTHISAVLKPLIDIAGSMVKGIALMKS